MKKITLNETEEADVQNLATSGSKGYDVLKKIFQEQVRDLASVMNIDPKSNVGLQTCARQLAYQSLLEMAEVMFPNDADAIKAARDGKQAPSGDKKISQWR